MTYERLPLAASTRRDTDVLYVFLHIPRTAGTTFVRHLTYNFPRDALLGVFQTPRNRLPRKRDIEALISGMAPSRLDKIKVIYGHNVYYAIHELFNKPAHYFTVLRHPIGRAISNYNYFLANYGFLLAGDKEKRFPRDSRELTFNRWLEVYPKNLQVRAVLNYRADDMPGSKSKLGLNEKHLEDAKWILDQFYFVSFTEVFDEDSLFLYSKLKINRFLKARQNVSGRSRVDVNDQIVEAIQSSSALDMKLYGYGREIDFAFKKDHPEFFEIVERMRNNRRFVVPVRPWIFDHVVSRLGMKRAVHIHETLGPIVESVRGWIRGGNR